VRYFKGHCKILKQFADRFHYISRLLEDGICDHFVPNNCGHRKHVPNELSEREAKFFLDRERQSSYHSHKFSGDFSARAKFHLHAQGKIVYCCSHFLRGAGGHDGTWFRKAESDGTGLTDENVPMTRRLREDRPVGVASIPGRHGRKRIDDVYGEVEYRWKGGRRIEQ
jgi:hypothetical protein